MKVALIGSAIALVLGLALPAVASNDCSLPPYRLLKRGMEGEDIRLIGEAMQEFVNFGPIEIRDHDVEKFSIFLEERTKEFQDFVRLSPTGIVDKKTYDALATLAKRFCGGRPPYFQ